MTYREEEITLPNVPVQAENNLKRRNPVREYATAGIICFAVAFLVYIIAKPEERKGPPQANSQTQSGLPSNHPKVDKEKMNVLQERLQSSRAALDNAPSDPRAHLDLANTLYDAGQVMKDPAFFTEALQYYEFYLSQHPNDPNAQTDLAYSLYRSGNLDRAISELNTVQKNAPSHQNSAFNLALMYKEKDQPDSVLAFMQRVVDIDPTSRVGKAAKEILDTYHNAH